MVLEATGQPKYYANWDDASIVVAPTPRSSLCSSIKLHNVTPPNFTSTNVTYLSEYQQGYVITWRVN